jgi:hypothetical protein
MVLHSLGVVQASFVTDDTIFTAYGGILRIIGLVILVFSSALRSRHFAR